MRQYRIFFLSAESFVLSEAEFLLFQQARLVTTYDANKNVLDIVEFTSDDKFFSFTKANITHILSEEVEKETDDVITPSTPAELRAEKQRQEAEQPTTLDEQLTHPDVAK